MENTSGEWWTDRGQEWTDAGAGSGARPLGEWTTVGVKQAAQGGGLCSLKNPPSTTRGGGQGRVKTMTTKERERRAEQSWEETRGDVPAPALSVRPAGPDRVPHRSWGQEGLLLGGRQPLPSPSTTGHKPVPVGPAPHSHGPTGAGLPEPTFRPWLSWTRVHRLGGQDKAHPEPAGPACSVTLSNAKSASRLFGPTPCLMQRHLPAPGVNHSHHRRAHLCHLRPLQQVWSPLVCQPGPDTRVSLPHTVNTQLATFLQRGKNQGWLKPREAAQDARQ